MAAALKEHTQHNAHTRHTLMNQSSNTAYEDMHVASIIHFAFKSHS